uniref:Uncharacterized protein n=1 Tax=Mus musculus TaxID=10090 RepID=Q6R5G3_MOUSE|nr:unknown [Mus musculus]
MTLNMQDLYITIFEFLKFFFKSFFLTYSLYSPLTAPSQSSHTAPTLATSGRQLDSCHHGLSLSITSSQTHHRGKTE